VTRILPILALSAACLLTGGCTQIFRFDTGATAELPAERLDDNFVAAVNATCVHGGTLIDHEPIKTYAGDDMLRYRYRCNPS
jgi:hypothetical protein